jgi:hypothetical protein
MRRVLFYIPFILFGMLYGFAASSGIGAISPIAIVWLVLFFMSGFTLSRNFYWGSLLGILPAISLIYMGTRDTGQIINEMPIGIIVLIYYIICGIVAYVNNKKLKSKNN